MEIERNNSLSKAMDYLGKLVGCFGLVSGLAYICGWSELYFYLGKLGARWAMDFTSPQFLVQKGMMWVLLCCFLSLSVLGFVRSIIDAQGIGGMITIAPAIVIIIINIFFPSVAEFFARWLFPYLMMGYGALILSVAIRAALDKQSPKIMVLMLLTALAWMAIVIPGVRASQEASDLRSGEIQSASATSKDFSGMVLGVIGDKLLLQDCTSARQLLVEPGGEWSILPDSLWCKEKL